MRPLAPWLLCEAKAKAAGMSAVLRNAQPLPTGGALFFLMNHGFVTSHI
jgi:hypothetical protein